MLIDHSHQRVSLSDCQGVVLLVLRLLLARLEKRRENDWTLVEWVLHVHQQVDRRQSFQLVLDHLLELHLAAQDALEEGVDVGDQRSIHLVALFGGEWLELDLMPWEVVSRQGHSPLKLLDVHGIRVFEVFWDVSKRWQLQQLLVVVQGDLQVLLAALARHLIYLHLPIRMHLRVEALWTHLLVHLLIRNNHTAHLLTVHRLSGSFGCVQHRSVLLRFIIVLSSVFGGLDSLAKASLLALGITLAQQLLQVNVLLDL